MAQGIELHTAGVVSSAAYVRSPAAAGNTGWWYTRNSDGETVRNMIKGGLPARVVGVPVYSDHGYAGLTMAASKIILPVVGTASFTWMVLSKVTSSLVGAANQPILMSNHNGSSGASMWLSDPSVGVWPAGRARAIVWGGAANSALAANVTNLSGICCTMLRVTGTAANVREVEAAVEGTATLPNAFVANGQPVEVCSYYNPAFAGGTKVAAVITWNRSITNQEAQDAYTVALNDLSYELP